MTKLTKSAAAKKLGVSRPTIYRLIRKGTLVPDENGLLALEDDTNVTERDESHRRLQSVTNILQSSERLKDKYIVQLEQTIKQLKDELATARTELRQIKNQHRFGQRQHLKNLHRESAELLHDARPALPTESHTPEIFNEYN